MTDWIEQIRQLGELREAGLLTDEEFVEQKELLLPSNGSDKAAASIVPDEEPELPIASGLSDPEENQRTQRHAELGGGPFGHYDSPLSWVCHAHNRAWCEMCSDLDRSTRGRTTQHWRRGKQYVCFKHHKDACPECRRLNG